MDEEEEFKKNLKDNMKLEENLNQIIENKDDEYYRYLCEDEQDLTFARKIAGNTSVFSQLWSQLGFQIDMFRISVPSIILHPISLLEKVLF
jgi:hypothetical protein